MIKKIFVFVFCMSIFFANFAYCSFNMTYIYGGTTNSIVERIDSIGNIIDEVSPSYFDINSDGSLKISDYFSSDLIEQFHDRNIKVVPFLSNHWNRNVGKSALNNRESLVKEIVSAIELYNLDGINIDIENVTEVERDAYTDLIRLLREQLPSNKILAVAVAANPNGYTNGWHGSYDYKKLGEYADYLMLMTYDEHYEFGSAGAVASYPFVEDSIQYALNYVPSEKIVLGLAFYARYWDNNDSNTFTGRAVSLVTLNKIFDEYDPGIKYDEETKTMIGSIKVSEIQASNDDYIFPAGAYDFYYDNLDTIKEKVGLVQKYKLKGTGSWAFGQETLDIWEAWNNKENVIVKDINVFNDVNNSTWSKKYIDYTYNTKLMIGKEEKVFGVSDYLTRAETVTIISRLLEMKNMQFIDTQNKIYFSDVDNHWSKDAVYNCVKLGLIIGYDDGTFRPDNPITREEIVTIINRLNLNTFIDNEQDIVFIDIDENVWSYNSIISVAKIGIINGYDDGTFKPKNNITREEMATIIYKICSV